jgi:PAS domain S-box-containing protein
VPPPNDTQRACETLRELQRQLANLARLGQLTTGLLQAAVDDCAEAVLVTDDQARIVMVNGPAARLLGISTRELQKLTIWDITHATHQAEFEVLWKEFRRAGRQRGHYGVRHMSGSVVEVTYCAEANVLPGRAVIVLCRLS